MNAGEFDQKFRLAASEMMEELGTALAHCRQMNDLPDVPANAIDEIDQARNCLVRLNDLARELDKTCAREQRYLRTLASVSQKKQKKEAA